MIGSTSAVTTGLGSFWEGEPDGTDPETVSSTRSRGRRRQRSLSRKWLRDWWILLPRQHASSSSGRVRCGHVVRLRPRPSGSENQPGRAKALLDQPPAARASTASAGTASERSSIVLSSLANRHTEGHQTYGLVAATGTCAQDRLPGQTPNDEALPSIPQRTDQQRCLGDHAGDDEPIAPPLHDHAERRPWSARSASSRHRDRAPAPGAGSTSPSADRSPASWSGGRPWSGSPPSHAGGPPGRPRAPCAGSPRGSRPGNSSIRIGGPLNVLPSNRVRYVRVEALPGYGRGRLQSKGERAGRGGPQGVSPPAL